MNEYNSKFTGTEIDAVLSRAAAGGAIDTDLALKAPLASPALTGTPTINGVPAANVGQLCNPNLLDNWYFGNSVDQRGGYVVPPNTPYVVQATGDSGMTGNEYVKVDYIAADGVPHFSHNGIECYCAISSVVRGYTGSINFTIDRWRLHAENTTFLVDTKTLMFEGGYWSGITQNVEFHKNYIGKTFTFSLLLNTNVPFHLRITFEGTGASQINKYYPTGVDGIVSLTFTVPDNAIFLNQQIVTMAQGVTGTAILEAAKLELGTQQTLAHQDENGNWVLNEIPDYGEQLAKCQRYQIQLCNGNNGFVGIGTATSATDCKILLPIPTTLRTTPSITYSGSFVLISGAGDNRIPVTAMSVQFCSNNAVSISCTTAGSLTVGQAYKLYYINNQAKLLLDANL